MAEQMTPQPRLTGWHVLGIFASAFAVIIGANLTLAVNAVQSFPGVETRNAYIASQSYDARRAAQEALGWLVTARIAGDRLSLRITDAAGRAVRPARLSAELGRATTRRDDRAPELRFEAGAFVARAALEPGRWILRLEAEAADGTPFRQRLPLWVAADAPPA